MGSPRPVRRAANIGTVDAFDAAYLAGGPRMAVDAAITSLVHAGRVHLHLGSSLKPNDAGVFGKGRQSALEESIFSAIGDSGWTIRCPTTGKSNWPPAG